MTTAIAIVAVAALTADPAAAQEKQKTSDQKDPAKRTVQLAEQHQSGVRGQALIYEAGRASGQEMAKHRVDLRLRGLKSGETYRVHLHGGTCARGGQVITPLAEVEADDAGRGEATATFAPEKLTADKGARAASAGEGEQTGQASVYVQARLPDGTPVACGDVPMKQDEKGT